ncbi:MAG: hypothetical protein IJH65_03740 [Methanobrevibacter sp.]|nr:hypothetical protein [Methanobrevibacter sp.]
MIGQKKLKNKIDSYTLSTLPHSILLVGELGSEVNEIEEYISDKFGLPIYDLTELISEEYIEEVYSMPSLGLYVIDGSKITEKEQNILLKFYEEPSEYMYIIFTCENKYNILETINTRSYELVMDLYSIDELEPLCNSEMKESILKIANTPGTVEELNHIDIKGLERLCTTVLDSMAIANYQNALTIANKINFKDEYDKYPLWAFIRMLSNTILEYIKKGNLSSSNLYWLVDKFNKNYSPLLDKKRYFENLITNMWMEVRRGN